MKRFLLCIMTLCLTAMALNAQTITWTGAGDGTNWSDSNNWDLLIVPSISNDVIIPKGSTLTINSHAFMKSIIVQGNTVLTINDALSFTNPSFFEENAIINWSFGRLHGGTLTNKGTININQYQSTFFPPEIAHPTILNNDGKISFNVGVVTVSSGGVLNNTETGIIEFKAVHGGISYYIDGIGTLNNYGIIKKEIGSGVFVISVITNNMGIIEALEGEIEFHSYSSYPMELNNSNEGIIKGTGTIDIHELTNFTNNGTFAPGASPGILTVIGDFTSSSTSKLAVELNGLNQGAEYDLLAIEGNAKFNGIVDVTMGFEGSINDEFIIATTTEAITERNLSPLATAEFDGKQYEFSVASKNNNELVLTITNKTLGVETNELTEKTIQLFPNPVSNDFTLRNNSNQNLQSAKIIDLNGRLVEKINLKNMEKDKIISMHNYATGIYLIKINSEDKSIVKKIVKI